MRYQPATSTGGPPIVLVMTTDGRNELLAEALFSSWEHLTIPLLARVLVDDSGTRAAEPFYAQFGAVIVHAKREGLASAVRDGWAHAARMDASYVFHMEDDFTLNGPAPLREMVNALEWAPYLAQMSLKRQPVNEAEEAAGGFMQVNRDLYADHHAWTEHRVCYSLNPHLAPRRVFAAGWPDTNEAGQTANLNRTPENRFGVWGSIDDPPAVTHIGHYRTPGWQL